MTQIPAMMPGVDPYQLMNFNARLAAWQNQQQSQQGNNALDLWLQLLQNGQQQQYQARQDNEKRRDQILEGRVGTRNRILEDLNGFGDSLVSDTNRDYKTSLNNSLAQLSRLGYMGSPDMQASIRARNERERQDSLRRVKDTIQDRYSSTDERLSNNVDEFLERIEDTYPNTGPIDQLSQQLGNSGVLPPLFSGGGSPSFSARTLQRPGAGLVDGPASGNGNGLGPRPKPITGGISTPIGNGLGPRPAPPSAGIGPPAGIGIGPRPAPITSAPRILQGRGGTAMSAPPQIRPPGYMPPSRQNAPGVGQSAADADRLMRNIQGQMAQQRAIDDRGSNFRVYNPRQPGDAPSMIPQQIIQKLPPGISNIVQGEPQFAGSGGFGMDPMMQQFLMGLMGREFGPRQAYGPAGSARPPQGSNPAYQQRMSGFADDRALREQARARYFSDPLNDLLFRRPPSGL